MSRAYDAVALSKRRSSPRFVGFLNEHEALFLRGNISPRQDIRFFGGYDDAVRVMLGAGADESDFPITALSFTYRDADVLRHKDFLGSLMALGLRRDAVGDILCDEGRAVVFVRDDVAPFIMSELTKIGRVGVRIGYADVSDLPVRDDADELTLILSSLRLDVFVAAVTNFSRDKAARLIKADMVAVDHVINNNVASNLPQGATVTIRKYGKFVLSDMLGTSRKGKLRVSVRHFR